MKTEMVDLQKINPAKYNPREITSHAFSGLCESVKKFGLQQPLIVNKRTGVLVSGHQRLKVADHLGLKKVPVVYVDLSDVEEKAMNITMNNKSIEGNFTEGIRDLLAEIKMGLDDDFIFDLNLDEVLKDLPAFEFDDEKVQKDNSGEEVEGDYSEFTHKCPKCKFEFN